MIDDKDKDEVMEIVKSTMKEILRDTGINEAIESINDSQRITKEEIMAEKNTKKRQQMIRENLDLFKE